MKELVVVFEDEMDRETIHMLTEDLQETGLQELARFDDGNKLVVAVPDQVPDPDYQGSLTNYWHAVIDDSLHPCCVPEGEDAIGVYAVYILEDFLAQKSYTLEEIGL
jgi:hypothetical protein